VATAELGNPDRLQHVVVTAADIAAYQPIRRLALAPIRVNPVGPSQKLL